ncbi:hypothetical protein GQ457_13G007190 [Hibiscus cannabinus]
MARALNSNGPNFIVRSEIPNTTGPNIIVPLSNTRTRILNIGVSMSDTRTRPRRQLFAAINGLQLRILQYPCPCFGQQERNNKKKDENEQIFIHFFQYDSQLKALKKRQ